MRRALLRIAAILLALLPAPAVAAPGGRATVSYLTTTTVYVDTGSQAGLREGDVVKVFRDGAFVTALEVTAVASKRASCRRADPAVEIRIGDEIRFLPAPAAEPVGPLPTEAIEAARRPGARIDRGWLREHGVRGRIGLRYLGLFDRSGFGEDYSQPSVDLRLQAASIGHPALHLSADVRARRTYRSPASGDAFSEGRTRVYDLAARWHRSGGRFRAAVGRQLSTSLTAVGIFDGASVEYGLGRHVRAGLFTGSQPDASTFGFSTDVREHGAYLEWRERDRGHARWRLTTGVIGSYTEGQVNRENFVFQGRYGGERLFVSWIQDVDLNRGWKREAGESALSLTSSFLSTRYRASDVLSLDAGLDTRRSVRTYRDRETPETEFDDSYRQGTWGGVEVRAGAATRFGAHVRHTTGGASGSANTATLTARTGFPRFHNLSARARSSVYRNDTVEGWLHSLSTGMDVGARTHAEVTAGLRDDVDRTSRAGIGSLRWYAADVDYRLTHAWVLLLSLERSQGDDEESEQVHVHALYRF